MALGKNLNNLLGDYFGEQPVSLSPVADTPAAPAADLTPSTQNDESVQYQQIAVNSIEVSPFQTRKKFDIDKIKALSVSIQENGLVHPITVLQKTHITDDKQYILLAGERRLRAVKLLENQTIPAIVRRQSDLPEENQAAFIAVENLHREDLNPIELAHTFEILMHAKTANEAELANFLGKSEQYVKNYLRLLSLDGMVQKLLIDGELTEGQARHLVPLSPEQQRTLGAYIVAKKLTVKEIQKRIATALVAQPQQQSQPKSKRHNLPHEIIHKADKLASLFTNSTLTCIGDEDNGKIVIRWKKPAQKSNTQ